MLRHDGNHGLSCLSFALSAVPPRALLVPPGSLHFQLPRRDAQSSQMSAFCFSQLSVIRKQQSLHENLRVLLVCMLAHDLKGCSCQEQADQIILTAPRHGASETARNGFHSLRLKFIEQLGYRSWSKLTSSMYKTPRCAFASLKPRPKHNTLS